MMLNSMKTSDITNKICANFPTDSDGRVHHMGVKEGEVANYIITVGDQGRALRLSELLDEPQNGLKLLIIKSSRGFLTITGHYKKLRVSIVAIGMGVPMMDFFIREVTAVVKGKLVIVRLGSCGSLKQNMPTGSLIVVNDSAFCYRNYDYFVNPTNDKKAYILSEKVETMETDFNEKFIELTQNIDDFKVFSGLNISTDSFYSSQGRTSDEFIDYNEKLMAQIYKKYPQAISLEMETFMLYHLAKTSINQRISAHAIQIVFADRTGNEFISVADAIPIEFKAGKYILDSLINLKIDDEECK